MLSLVQRSRHRLRAFFGSIFSFFGTVRIRLTRCIFCLQFLKWKGSKGSRNELPCATNSLALREFQAANDRLKEYPNNVDEYVELGHSAYRCGWILIQDSKNFRIYKLQLQKEMLTYHIPNGRVCRSARLQGDKGTNTDRRWRICRSAMGFFNLLSFKVQCSLGQDWCLLTTTGEALFGGLKRTTNLGCKWFVFRFLDCFWLKAGFFAGIPGARNGGDHSGAWAFPWNALSMTSSNFLNTCNGSNDHWCRGSKSALTVIPARLVELVDLGREHAEFSLSLWVFLAAMLPGLQWPGFCKESAHRTGQESSILELPAAGVTPTTHWMCIGWGNHWQREGRSRCGTLQQGRLSRLNLNSEPWVTSQCSLRHWMWRFLSSGRMFQTSMGYQMNPGTAFLLHTKTLREKSWLSTFEVCGFLRKSMSRFSEMFFLADLQCPSSCHSCLRQQRLEAPTCLIPPRWLLKAARCSPAHGWRECEFSMESLNYNLN